jgi:hypothetical protein
VARLNRAGPLFDFSDDHVRPIRGAAQHWIGLEDQAAHPVMSLPADDLVAGAAEPHGEDVEIRHGSRRASTVTLRDRGTPRR